MVKASSDLGDIMDENEKIQAIDALKHRIEVVHTKDTKKIKDLIQRTVPKEKLEMLKKASDEQIMTFARHMNLDQNLIQKFLDFKLSVSGQEVMDKFQVKGPEVGQIIQKLETENFAKLIA